MVTEICLAEYFMHLSIEFNARLQHFYLVQN